MAYTSPTFSTNNQFIKYRIVVTELSQSVENNSTTINVKVQAWRTNTGYTTDDDGTCYCNINGSNYSNSWSYGQKPIRYNSYTTLFDRDVVIPHETDGSKTLYVSSYIRHDRFSSNSQGFNVTLPQIPRAATVVSAPSFNDTDNPTLIYSNPAGDVVDSIEACISTSNTTPVAIPEIAWRTLTKLGSSYTFTLSQSERESLLAATPNSNTLTVYYIIKTVISGITYYESASATMNVVDADPIVTGITYEDTNSSTIAITGDNSKLIQNFSTLRVNYSHAEGKKGAYLSRVSLSVNYVETHTDYPANTQSVDNQYVDFGIINSVDDLTADLTITDSRGNSKKVEIPLTILGWALPTATISLARRSNYYPETDITVTANYSSLDGNNSVTISYEYKETGASTWSSPASLTDGVTTTITLDNTKSYDFRFTVADLLGSTIYNKALQIGIPILFIDRIKRAVGIGTLPDQPNMLSVDRRINLKNLAQKSLLDLWTTSTANTDSASLYIYNQLANILVRLGGGDDGGYLRLNRPDGTNGTYIGATLLYLFNSSNKAVFYASESSNGGVIIIFNSNGDQRVRIWVGGNDDGVIDILDSQGNTTISLAGETGEVICKKAKQSEGVVEVVDTAFSSGNNTFNDDGYQTITVIAKVTSTSSYNIINIPVKFLESTDKKFCISDELNYVTFYLKLDNGVYTITWNSANGSGASIEKVYAHY